MSQEQLISTNKREFKTGWPFIEQHARTTRSGIIFSDETIRRSQDIILQVASGSQVRPDDHQRAVRTLDLFQHVPSDDQPKIIEGGMMVMVDYTGNRNVQKAPKPAEKK